MSYPVYQEDNSLFAVLGDGYVDKEIVLVAALDGTVRWVFYNDRFTQEDE
jgi:hypothetical protein